MNESPRAVDLVVRAFPLLDGRLDAFRALCGEVTGERAVAAKEFYSRYGVARETWHLQSGPDGRPWVICVTQIAERSVPEVAADYAAATAGFDAWLKSRVLELTEIDLDTQPLGPPTECLFDTRDLEA